MSDGETRVSASPTGGVMAVFAVALEEASSLSSASSGRSASLFSGRGGTEAGVGCGSQARGSPPPLPLKGWMTSAYQSGMSCFKGHSFPLLHRPAKKYRQSRAPTLAFRAALNS